MINSGEGMYTDALQTARPPLTNDKISITNRNVDEPAHIIELKNKLILLTYQEAIEFISFALILSNQRT